MKAFLLWTALRLNRQNSWVHKRGPTGAIEHHISYTWMVIKRIAEHRTILVIRVNNNTIERVCLRAEIRSTCYSFEAVR